MKTACIIILGIFLIIGLTIVVGIRIYYWHIETMSTKGLIQCQNLGMYGFRWTTPEDCSN